MPDVGIETMLEVKSTHIRRRSKPQVQSDNCSVEGQLRVGDMSQFVNSACGEEKLL